MALLPYQMKNVGLDFVESNQFQNLSLTDPPEDKKKKTNNLGDDESNQFQNLSLTDPPEDKKKKTNNLGDDDLYAAFKKTESLKDAIAFLASGQYDTTTAYRGVSKPATYNCYPYANLFTRREIEAMISHTSSPLSVGTYSPTNPEWYKHIPTPTFVGLANSPPPFPGRE